MTHPLEDPLRVNGADVGCDAGIPCLEEYVEIELAGGDPAERFPTAAAHFAACRGCRADHDALLEAVRLFRAPAPAPGSAGEFAVGEP